ncbi:MAG TPA: hypothetical protein VIR16_08040 [Candidatus Limnocylindrales bacterium]
MHVLVVYESMYGNTAAVAAAIAEAIGEDAVAVEAGAAPHVLPADVELLVVGGPTHAHGMSVPSTRDDAAGRVSQPTLSRGGYGIREWIADLRADRSLLFATFDTRIKGPKLLWGSAAESAAKALTAAGHRPALAPTSFLLDGMFGSPYGRIPASEIERARAFGARLVDCLPIPTR